ncbi:substrate-binding domain-containing protein [Neoehrlichia mikurensis]|uniref:Substrate-binding domain-containing protein n=2 Tax=Neoehrlichia mikurensis TaxID=89586 RepID=A0A9Q9F3D2_9RICK|nr:substrate-binding domain-containing protein [Neoehrlichia mikurensis]UTO55127.1 substrate-binding domain-containing protein [Neoehrlichia mikurensis]UTO56047.1 substrate-binding domain-containing protein [Neoehrlichia mikurensis]
MTITHELQARHIRVVGSSTVFPFISSIAEEFGKFSSYTTPVIESVGSGMGFNMFCAGAGDNTPDITMSSRKIKDAEVELCKTNKVNDIVELIIGYDGIVIANSNQNQKVDFTIKDLFSALSKYEVSDEYNDTISLNNYKSWHEIHNRLPNVNIEIYGPHKNTGTYDILIKTIMLNSCMNSKIFIDIYPKAHIRQKICGSIRDDGKYIEVATNENVIIHKIAKNNSAFGILSFSFLIKNQDKIQGNKIAGVEPNYESISSGKYILSRPIYIYVKKEHLASTPGLKKFLEEIVNVESISKHGYLVNSGFIPLPQQEFAKTKKKVMDLIK